MSTVKVQVGATYAIDVPCGHLCDEDADIVNASETVTCQIHIVQLAGDGALGYISVTGRSGIPRKRLYVVSDAKVLHEVEVK